MKKEELYRFVDHTALKAVTTWKEIQQLCQEARFFRMASVCIPSSYVKRAHEYFPELNICTVVGFPLGNASTEAKTGRDTSGNWKTVRMRIDMVNQSWNGKESGVSAGDRGDSSAQGSNRR